MSDSLSSKTRSDIDVPPLRFICLETRVCYYCFHGLRREEVLPAAGNSGAVVIFPIVVVITDVESFISLQSKMSKDFFCSPLSALHLEKETIECYGVDDNGKEKENVKEMG